MPGPRPLQPHFSGSKRPISRINAVIFRSTSARSRSAVLRWAGNSGRTRHAAGMPRLGPPKASRDISATPRYAAVQGKASVQQIILEAEAGQLSAELTRRGIAADTKVHVVVELRDAEPPMADIAQADIAQAGNALDWLAEEPDLYTDADLAEPAR
jgi:hypothetical protein